MNLGTQTGSVMNHLMSRSAGVPKVGDGATVLEWTDRTAGTIIYVSPSGKTCRVREDKATRTDANGMSECQTYAYEPNPEGREWTFRLGKRGWTSKGIGLLVGERRQYYDYSF